MDINDRRRRDGLAFRRESTDVRRRILDAARDVFVQDGYEATSMRAVAKRIGYRPATIYRHFVSKEDLLREICRRDFRGLSAAFFLHASVVRDPVERLRRMGRTYLDFALRHPRQYSFLFMSPRPAGGARHPGDSDPVDDAFVFLLATTAEGAAQGRFRPECEDPDQVALLFWGSLHGLASLHVARLNHDGENLGDLVSLSEATIEVMFRGLLR
jgi:AcrR family transcriptional regulator